MQPWNIAHRGGAQLMPENTLAAFADAIARGCDGAELDVQLTADGRVVVHHDFRLKADLARKDGAWLAETGPRIKELTWDELRHLDVGTVRPASDYARTHPLLKPLDAPVPALEDVVALAGRGFKLFVELKCDGSNDSADPVALADAAGVPVSVIGQSSEAVAAACAAIGAIPVSPPADPAGAPVVAAAGVAVKEVERE